MTEILVPAHALPARTPAELLTLARSCLGDANRVTMPGARYANAHLAALRAAAAVLAARARPAPTGRRRRITTMWVVLAEVAPELWDWAEYWAGNADRARADIGAYTVTAEDADRLTGQATQFVQVVESLLGLEPATDRSGR